MAHGVHFIPFWSKKKLVNFGSLTKKLYTLMLTHLTGLFRETIFRPLGGAGPSNFYTPYKW